ncbi:uridine kinase [Scenedesmus sp. PABB004]|nr:uridine kinase [Scenedesmus sp. PABB004]
MQQLARRPHQQLAAPRRSAAAARPRRRPPRAAGQEAQQQQQPQQQQLVITGDCFDDVVQQLARRALDAARALPGPPALHVVGIAGAPGSGKSTLARAVAAAVNAQAAGAGLGRGAAVAPMDGFHLTRAQLDAMPDPQAAHARRGAPWTFDGEAFVSALAALRRSGAAALPSFDHALGDPVPGDAVIDAARHAVVLVEGNYLLLRDEPWAALRPLLDDTWFVECPLDVAMARVIARQTAPDIGLTPAQSAARVAGNDRPNAELVAACRGDARVLVPSTVPLTRERGGGGDAARR